VPGTSLSISGQAMFLRSPPINAVPAASAISDQAGTSTLSGSTSASSGSAAAAPKPEAPRAE
jgi:hypothetical protein